MMAEAADPILEFLGKSIEVAYLCTQEGIYHFLNEIIAGIRPDDSDKADELERIIQQIIWLGAQNDKIPDSGLDYLAAELTPAQHIYRQLNPNDTPPPPPDPDPVPIKQPPPQTKSQFLVGHRVHELHNLSLKYWSPYDLLGLFLSSLGPAPNAATKDTFFLPLTAMYGRWCQKIAGANAGGVGPLPAIFQCTWREVNDKPGDFFLGATLAGYQFVPGETGSWDRVLKYERFLLLDSQIPSGYDFDRAPIRVDKTDIEGKERRPTETGQRFGNCGETYPFIHLLRDHPDTSFDISKGLALKNGFVEGSKYKGEYAYVPKQVAQRYENPCLNCQRLISHHKGNPLNFQKVTATKKASQSAESAPFANGGIVEAK